MKCEFCLADIPEWLLESRRIHGGRLKYCSELCNKRASYMRRTNPKQSVFKGNPQPGIAWENWFIEKYGAERPSRSHNTPFDFWYNGRRVDLKVVNLYKHKTKPDTKWWSFMSGGRREEVDDFICIGLVDNKPVKMFVIPESDFPKRGACISPKGSKYDKYLKDL